MRNIESNIKFTAKHEVSASGNKEWGTFEIVSSRKLFGNQIETLCSIHGVGGQSLTHEEEKIGNDGWIYRGSYSCWCD